MTLRVPLFIADAGAACVARSAGASPNSTQVRSASAQAKPNTRQSEPRATNTESDDVFRNDTRKPLIHRASIAPHAAPAIASSRLSDMSCRTIRRARGTDRQPHGDLALARGRPGQHQVGEVGAGDQQHEAGRREQHPQRRLVDPPERRHAGGGAVGRELERRVDLDAPLVVDGRDRLAKDRRRDRLEVGRRLIDRSRPASAVRLPRGTSRSCELSALEPPTHERLGAERQRHVERSSGVDAEESRRRDACELEVPAVEPDRASGDRRIAAEFALPERITQHRRRRITAAPVVVCAQQIGRPPA